MKKPTTDTFDHFAERFKAASAREAIALQKQGKQPAGTRATSGSKKSAFKKGKGYQGKNPRNNPNPRGPAFPND